MPDFPQWIVAVFISGVGVWAAGEINAQYAWWLAILLVLGVLITRDQSLGKLNEFIALVLGRNGST